MSEVSDLLALQDTDLSIIRAQNKLDTLPEKQKIVELRNKRSEVLRKRAQIVDMKDDLDAQVTRLQTEEADLLDKIKTDQGKLDSEKDYRVTTSITREMEGLVKRREKVDFELSGLADRGSKIDVVSAQVEDALRRIDTQESELTESYRKLGHGLQDEIAGLKHEREQYASSLPPELLARYEKIAASKNDIAVGQLQKRMCSVCRVEYQEGQLLKVRSESPISTCPICHRLLVVPKD